MPLVSFEVEDGRDAVREEKRKEIFAGVLEVYVGVDHARHQISGSVSLDLTCAHGRLDYTNRPNLSYEAVADDDYLSAENPFSVHRHDVEVDERERSFSLGAGRSTARVGYRREVRIPVLRVVVNDDCSECARDEDNANCVPCREAHGGSGVVGRESSGRSLTPDRTATNI